MTSYRMRLEQPDLSGGACANEDPELFFAKDRTSMSPGQIAACKAICNRCEVIAPCRKWAVEARIDFGVWGGMTEEERYEWRRAKANAERA